MSYIKKRYQYIAVSTPVAAGAFLFLSIAGWIFNLVDGQTVFASPFLGAAAALGVWFFYETGQLFDIKRPVKSFALTSDSISKPLNWMLEQTDKTPDYQFIFRGYGKNHRLECDIDEGILYGFCKIGTTRATRNEVLHETADGFKRLTKNQIWSTNFFVKRRGYSADQVNACKRVLFLTGQYINWSQGKAGQALSDNPLQLTSRAKRRWYIDLSQPLPTSTGFNRLSLAIKKLI